MTGDSAGPKRTLSAITLALFAGLAGAATANTPAPGSELARFQAYKQQQQSAFEQYRSAYLNAFDAYRKAVLAHWDDAPLSDRHKLVQYSDDKRQRTEVDYQSGTITIAVVHQPDQLPDPAQIQASLAQLVQEDVASAQAADPIMAELDSAPGATMATPLPLVPELNQQLDGPEQDSHARLAQMVANAEVNTRPRDYSAERLVALQAELKAQEQAALRELERQQELIALARAETPEQAEPEPVPASQSAAVVSQSLERQQALTTAYQARAEDPTSKQITTYRIQLPSQSQQKRARPFLPQAQEQSAQFEVALELVLAIMQAESSFNPMARSHIPAFGLMQIVPGSAGRDVREKFENSSQPPSAEELYQPDFNIRFGSAYLNILDQRYLRGVSDPQSRLYCVIAAYNTGAGNVAKAFNADGSRRLKSALPRINAMAPEAVYQHLLEHLPYEETRKYLKKVRSYQEGYAALGDTLRL
ncbi:transglycosylase SLT domain-containing protein [Ferrimonas balearica]|uniref:transglycosylase SLT domain-containing protein n=1 Tax=Ferrimonas balearica TaxID=44012 RepID=UPI001C94D691|nr:transglycosylase SLT domain-containing protein [Ferrimonas balearica]MBY6224652.1 transglycosylase SLT domain-containing protein [Ferrimonas balearica]